jgi:hypothetical protein
LKSLAKKDQKMVKDKIPAIPRKRKAEQVEVEQPGPSSKKSKLDPVTDQVEQLKQKQNKLFFKYRYCILF